MKAKVFLTKSVPKEAEERLAQFCDFDVWEGDYPINKELLGDSLKDVVGILGSNLRVNESLLELAPNLKIVSNNSVGYDNFDTDFMKKNGIMGTHTPGVLDETVADLAWGMILSIARRISELDSYAKAGKWKPEDDKEFWGADVHGKTLGVIGLGRIGSKIAKRGALGFDMKVLYHSRSRKEELENELGLVYADLDHLLKESDFVVLMLPLIKETEQFIGANEFKLMKETAFFINISRGKIVDEKALIAALEAGEIAGAALDVYEKEPVAQDNPLLSMANVLTLPHIGSSTAKTRMDMAMLAVDNLLAGLRGDRPENLVPELTDLI